MRSVAVKVSVALLLVGCGTDVALESGEAESAALYGAPGRMIHARGAFTCDFQLPSDLPLGEVPAVIERDRMYMAAQPGMLHKHLPIGIDPATGALYSGGRYLFEQRADAAAYSDFVHEGFVLDGVQFLDRPMFIAPECRDWGVIGAWERAPIDSAQVIMRTERFEVPAGEQTGVLQRAWPSLVREAAEQELTAAWLLYSREDQVASLVYFADRVAPPDPTALDFPSLEALASRPPLGAALVDGGYGRVFDRTQWVLTIWFPFEAGDQGAPSLWPHSPPLPAPYCGDSVCEVSQGEDGGSCPADCGATCGDGICDADESTRECPGDCRL